MFLYACDVYLVYPTFSLNGKLLFPLGKDWEGLDKCEREVHLTLKKVIAEHAPAHGKPSIGQYVEITLIKDDDAGFPWYAFILRGNGKPCMQWWTHHYPIHIVQESELLNAEER